MPSKTELHQIILDAEKEADTQKKRADRLEAENKRLTKAAEDARKAREELLWSLGLVEVDRLKSMVTETSIQNSSYPDFDSCLFGRPEPARVSIDFRAFDIDYMNTLLRKLHA